MTDQPRIDELAQLRAEVTALRARVDRPRYLFSRRFRPLALVALLVALLPLSILAAGPTFSDLGTAAPVHQPNIQAIGDAGITTGFEDPNDPTKRLYNPKDNVTREEMASFLARTAGLGGNPPVANAAQLGGIPAANYVQTTNQLLPIAFATVNVDGTKLSGTPNISVIRTNSGQYQITIAGENYAFGQYTTVATLIGLNGEISTSSNAQGDLLIATHNSNGGFVSSRFQFAVFKP